MTNTKRTNLIFTLLYFGDAFVSPFLALYFISLGFNKGEIAILLAIKPFCFMIGNFVYGLFSKDIKRDLNVLKIILALLSFSIFGFAFAKSFGFVLACMIIWSLHNSVYFSYLDGIAQKCCVHDKTKYSITRMFGSAGYCLCLILGGFLGIANALNYTAIFVASGILTIISIAILFFYKPFFIKENEVIEKPSFISAFKSKNFIIFILFYLLVIGVWKITDDYCSQFFNSLGLSDGQWSFLYAGEVIIEIVSILLLEKFIKKKTSYIWILVTSALMMMVRLFLFAMPLPTIALIITTGILRGTSWGFYIVGFMRVFKKLIGANLITQGTTFIAVISSIVQTIGNYFYLPLVDALGTTWAFVMFGSIQLIGTILLILIAVSFIKKEKTIINPISSVKLEKGE